MPTRKLKGKGIKEKVKKYAPYVASAAAGALAPYFLQGFKEGLHEGWQETKDKLAGKGKVGDFVRKHKGKIAAAAALSVPIASGIAGLYARHLDHNENKYTPPGFHNMYLDGAGKKKKRGGGPKIDKTKKLIKKYAAPAAAAAALAWGVNNAYHNKYDDKPAVLNPTTLLRKGYNYGGGKGKFSTMPVKPKPIGMGKRKRGGIVAQMEDYVDPNTGLVSKRIKKRGRWDVAY